MLIAERERKRFKSPTVTAVVLHLTYKISHTYTHSYSRCAASIVQAMIMKDERNINLIQKTGKKGSTVTANENIK
jgi:hypothetical protein